MIYEVNNTKYDLSTLEEEVKDDFLTLAEVQQEIQLLKKKAYVLQCCGTELNRKIQAVLTDEIAIKE